MLAAEHDHGVTWRVAVGARTQPPPHAEGIHNCDPRGAIEQSLNKAFRCVGLARAGGADNRNPVVERVSRKTNRWRTAAAGAGC